MARKHNFEEGRDFGGAREEAKAMAQSFTNFTGIQLKFDHIYIDSPMYGYTELDNDFPEDDPDAYYVVQFKEIGVDYETVCMIPSLGKVAVCRSITDNNPYDERHAEGMVSPKTGRTTWKDYIIDGARPLTAWAAYRPQY